MQLDVVEVYPYIEYAKYLLAGSTAMAIFIVAMIGGGITFIDDKSRGLHEGYLLTPIHKTELVLGLIGAGAIKGLMAGMALTIIGGLIVGIPRLWDPVRLFYLTLVVLVASFAMISFMFLADGAGGRSAGAARDFRRAEYAAFFPFGRDFPDRRLPAVAALDFGDRSVHVYRARAAKSDPQKYRH